MHNCSPATERARPRRQGRPYLHGVSIVIAHARSRAPAHRGQSRSQHRPPKVILHHHSQATCICGYAVLALNIQEPFRRSRGCERRLLPESRPACATRLAPALSIRSRTYIHTVRSHGKGKEDAQVCGGEARAQPQGPEAVSGTCRAVGVLVPRPLACQSHTRACFSHTGHRSE